MLESEQSDNRKEAIERKILTFVEKHEDGLEKLGEYLRLSDETAAITYSFNQQGKNTGKPLSEPACDEQEQAAIFLESISEWLEVGKPDVEKLRRGLELMNALVRSTDEFAGATERSASFQDALPWFNARLDDKNLVIREMRDDFLEVLRFAGIAPQPPDIKKDGMQPKK